MSEPIRISVQKVRQKVNERSALLVCAYEDDLKFNKFHLEGAISLAEFKSKVSALGQDQEIVFYWAWGKEESAVGQAVNYMKKGFLNVKVLKGGVEAWRNAGYPIQKWYFTLSIVGLVQTEYDTIHISNRYPHSAFFQIYRPNHHFLNKKTNHYYMLWSANSFRKMLLIFGAFTLISTLLGYPPEKLI